MQLVDPQRPPDWPTAPGFGGHVGAFGPAGEARIVTFGPPGAPLPHTPRPSPIALPLLAAEEANAGPSAPSAPPTAHVGAPDPLALFGLAPHRPWTASLPAFALNPTSVGPPLDLYLDAGRKLHLDSGGEGLRWLSSYLGRPLPYAAQGAQAPLRYHVGDGYAFALGLEQAVVRSVDRADAATLADSEHPEDEVQVLCRGALANRVLRRLEADAHQRNCKTPRLAVSLGQLSVARRARGARLALEQPRVLLELMYQGEADWRRDLVVLGASCTFDALFAALQNGDELRVTASGRPMAPAPAAAARPQRLLYVSDFDETSLEVQLVWVHGGAAPWILPAGAPGPTPPKGCHLAALQLRLHRNFWAARRPCTAIISDIWLASDAADDGACPD